MSGVNAFNVLNLSLSWRYAMLVLTAVCKHHDSRTARLL